MLIGVPKEIKVHEYRVGLTPDSAREFVTHGHQVLVQTNAGPGSAAPTSATAPPAQRSPAAPRRSSTRPR
jgi:alanine dehydrogenase